jgi:hypothetical protein
MGIARIQLITHKTIVGISNLVQKSVQTIGGVANIVPPNYMKKETVILGNTPNGTVLRTRKVDLTVLHTRNVDKSVLL